MGTVSLPGTNTTVMTVCKWLREIVFAVNTFICRPVQKENPLSKRIS
jgi:hypothetical protein